MTLFEVSRSSFIVFQSDENYKIASVALKIDCGSSTQRIQCNTSTNSIQLNNKRDGIEVTALHLSNEASVIFSKVAVMQSFCISQGGTYRLTGNIIVYQISNCLLLCFSLKCLNMFGQNIPRALHQFWCVMQICIASKSVSHTFFRYLHFLARYQHKQHCRFHYNSRNAANTIRFCCRWMKHFHA